jgi:hypothetical protein
MLASWKSLTKRAGSVNQVYGCTHASACIMKLLGKKNLISYAHPVSIVNVDEDLAFHPQLENKKVRFILSNFFKTLI